MRGTVAIPEILLYICSAFRQRRRKKAGFFLPLEETITRISCIFAHHTLLYKEINIMAHQQSPSRFREFFRHRPTGRALVLIVCLKLFVMFAILRIFFFQPTLSGLNDGQKAQVVGTELAE